MAAKNILPPVVATSPPSVASFSKYETEFDDEDVGAEEDFEDGVAPRGANEIIIKNDKIKPTTNDPNIESESLNVVFFNIIPPQT
ncbi:hypothetical protein V6C21_06105 [[Clostridium] cellulosi]|jgi:hypothetical protein